MATKLNLDAADLIGFSRLANDATAGMVNVVEEVHHNAAFRDGSPPVEGFRAGITALVYNNIRVVTGLIGAGLASVPVPRPAKERKLSPAREALVAAVNGVAGDYLLRTNNPLAISMSLRRHGRPLEIERNALRSAVPKASGKLLLLAHGLCLNDLQWKRKGHDHGSALSRDFGYTPVYLHYNTGLHVSENGRLLASLIETLLEEWPVEVQELTTVGHSMGGLVLRSACHHGSVTNQQWPRQLRRLIFLGTPHHGAPLEHLGSWADRALALSRYTVPFARIGKMRSAGITDMRFGNLLDEDWRGRDRFAPTGDVRTPVSLPQGVQVYAIAATKQEKSEAPKLDLFGDGLVPVSSALGRHSDPRMDLRLRDSNTWVGHGMNHWDLLTHPAVYDHLARWCA